MLTRQAEVWHLILAVVVMIFTGGAYVGTCEVRISSTEKRVDQNASLLSMGNRYTKEDHLRFAATVDDQIRSVRAEINSTIKEIRDDLTGLRNENMKLLQMIYQKINHE